jgi:hypothetical protein
MDPATAMNAISQEQIAAIIAEYWPGDTVISAEICHTDEQPPAITAALPYDRITIIREVPPGIWEDVDIVLESGIRLRIQHVIVLGRGKHGA